MARHGEAFKNRAVARLLPTESTDVALAPQVPVREGAGEGSLMPLHAPTRSSCHAAFCDQSRWEG